MSEIRDGVYRGPSGNIIRVKNGEYYKAKSLSITKPHNFNKYKKIDERILFQSYGDSVVIAPEMPSSYRDSVGGNKRRKRRTLRRRKKRQETRKSRKRIRKTRRR